jgi:hypothetical protein
VIAVPGNADFLDQAGFSRVEASEIKIQIQKTKNKKD